VYIYIVLGLGINSATKVVGPRQSSFARASSREPIDASV
jgi:hypothetical protein